MTRRIGRRRRLAHASVAMAMVAAVVAAPALASTTDYYRDSFVSGGFSGSTGTVAWSTNWLESEGDGPGEGLIQVTGDGKCFDGDCLVLGKDTSGSASVEREMDLSDALSADLTFVYEVHQHSDGNGSVRLQARAQSGSWTTLATYPLGPDVGPVFESLDLLPHASAATRIRFDVVGSTDDSHLNVDDIEVEWVASTNVPPVLDPVGDKWVQESSELGFTATATDPNAGDGLVFSLAGSPPSGASITSGGVFSWTPTETQGPGTFTFDVVVTDDGLPVKSDSETITVTVGETNSSPVLSPVGDKSAQEGTKLSFTASASDSDVPSNTLTFSLASGPPSGASITAGGAFTWTPLESQGPGTYTFDVVVSDNGSPSRSDQESITVTVSEVNQPPVLGTIGSQATEQGSTLTFTATASDSDVPGNSLTYRLEGSVPPGASIGSSTGAFTWSVPTTQAAGDYVFDVVVADDGSPNKSDKETITVSVSPVNQAPTMSPLGDRTVDEQTTVSFTARATDPDGPDGDLRFSLSGAPWEASIGATSGVFSWTPSESRGPGSFTFAVVVTDAAGVPKSDQETITIDVREVNRPPVVVAPAPQTVEEGSRLGVDIVATDPDVPTNALSYDLEDAPPGVSIDASGLLSFEPVEGQGDAVYWFEVLVTDDGTPKMSDRAAVSIEVVAVNQPPTIEPIPDQFSEESDDISLEIVVEDPEAAAVNVEVDGLPPGLTYDLETGRIIGTISEGAAVESPFSVVVTATDTDAEDPRDSHTTFLWNVDTANTAPAGLPAAYDTDEDTPIGIILEATDPEGDLVTFSISGPPANGTATLDDGGRVRYQPAPNWNGVDGFTFVAADPREVSDPVRITIRVASVNDPPVAVDDDYIAYAGGSLEVQAPGILENDVDFDDEPLRIGFVTTPAHGEVEVQLDGRFIYLPEPEFLGLDSFTYRLTDQVGATAVGTVTIEVREAVSSGVRTAVVSEIASVEEPSGADGPPIRVVERSLVLMSSAAQQTIDDVGFPVVLLALAMGLLLSLGRLSGIPLVRGARRTGRIEVVDLDEGFGLIRPDDDLTKTVFFHRSVLRPRSSHPSPGDRVTFRTSSGVQRPVATRVHPDTKTGLSRLRSTR